MEEQERGTALGRRRTPIETLVPAPRTDSVGSSIHEYCWRAFNTVFFRHRHRVEKLLRGKELRAVTNGTNLIIKGRLRQLSKRAGRTIMVQ
jgi:hypothetical protein